MARHADRPHAAEQLHVEAPPARIWPYVSDIAFVVAASDELQAVAWSDGAAGPAFAGRHFVGTNRNDYFGEWQTTSTVIECDEPRAFAWAVGDPDEPNSTWRFTLAADRTGTLVTQSVRIGLGPSGLHVAIAARPDREEAIIERRLAQHRAAMRGNLEAVRDAVGSSPG